MMENFISHLKVDKQIVPLLSKSTYHRSFAYAIRELVSNAYDADALTIKININKDFSQIEIEDDGNGMTYDEFDYYCTIAGQKRDIKLSRKFKRRRIGQFGIGFLSIFPFCEFLEITTTVENSDEILSARIPAKKYFESESDKEIQNIEISGSIFKRPSIKSKHFTKINLVKPTYLVQQYFSIAKTTERKTIKRWNPIDRFKWDLQEDLPISYNPNSQFNKLLKYDEPIGIDVSLNGQTLYRNEVGNFVLDSGSEKISGVEYQYIITTNYEAIDPVEARGIKLRINNVGIGKRTYFELQRSRGFSRLNWLSGEVLISDSLKESLNISRDSFISNQEVESFLESISGKLRDKAYYVEDIAVAEKELVSLTKETPNSSVEPKEEIIKANINKLQKRGFKLITVHNEKGATSPLVKIDKLNKTVTLGNVETFSKDEIKIFGKPVKITYKKWDFRNSNLPSCRFGPDNSVEVNQDYPLFQSKQHGNIFKKIHIMLLISQQKNKNSSDMLNDLMKEFLMEFNEFFKG